MGDRGPVPNRSNQRRRVNAPEIPIDEAPASEDVEQLPADSDWHPIALAWYESLAKSGQAIFYEPSDWATAYLVAESLSRDLKPQYVGVTYGNDSSPIFEEIPIKGASLAAYLKAFGNLLTTEGDRRRMRIELARAQGDADADAAAAAVHDYRSRIVAA